ncbi:uncharacterized protein LOC117776792 [Hippoglossus hippoglossus]|uniref:uncharacterized protein LOC117776792 n=1 Tax=Hippoglossus hippoglossus TaxID=8267 RepID=UPI00148BB84E|nr:uncharacterized protein LOC117776792 [Hippoglossus hippoglossus]
MLCPAAVSAAAVWLLAVLGPGLSLSAEDNAEQGFTLCSDCFYRQTPPLGASAGPLLHPLCHTLPRGQAFATLSKPACDTAVYSAFHLRHGWTEEEEGEELLSEEENDIKAAAPILLRGGGDPSHSVSPSDSPLQHWDSTVTTLVQSSISPQCSTLEGDLYILTGAGGLRAAEDGDEECQMGPLWSAVCCAGPEGKGGFSVGLIREAGEGDRQVSLKELEEMLGVEEMFSEGCGGADVETAGILVGLQGEGKPENLEKMDVDAPGEETSDADVDSDTAGPDTEGETNRQDTEAEANRQDTEAENIRQDAEAATNRQDTEAETNPDVQPEEAGEVAQETSADAVESTSSSEEHGDVRRSGAVTSESPDSSADQATADDQETDTNSTSTLVYILSTAISILKAPLHPLVSTVTKLPGQVTYVLQEDLGVLSALPGDTYSLLHLVTSDLLSWMGSAADLLLGVGETGVHSSYYCASSMLGALYSHCHTGVTGVGTLAGDTVGVVGDAVDNAWWVTKFFGGRLWKHSEGYVGTVATEMGDQAMAVGGGFGKLTWRSGNAVCNVFRLGGGFVMGIMDMLIGAVREASGQEEQTFS